MDIFYNNIVTLYNRFEDNYIEKWFPTVFKNVYLSIKSGTGSELNGNKAADEVVLHIQTGNFDKRYLLPKEWKNSKDKEASFTVAYGDFFVNGDTSGENLEQDGFAEYMKNKYDLCFQVTSVEQYTIIPHLEVGGK